MYNTNTYMYNIHVICSDQRVFSKKKRMIKINKEEQYNLGVTCTISVYENSNTVTISLTCYNTQGLYISARIKYGW